MATGFVGRSVELGLLRTRVERVAVTRRGVAVAIRGRRQVGKSRLVQEFCDAAQVPYLYFTATKGMPVSESLAIFLAELKSSGIAPDPETLPESISGWPDAFRVLATALGDTPTIVVIDELPWLAEQDDVFDGALQTAWDRLLQQRPVLLLLLGSDLHMMERLTAYDRPFYGRADNLVLDPLNPAEVGRALGLDAAESIDAHLITGGLPGILRSWPPGLPPLEFVRRECSDPAAPLFGVPESTLLAEFPVPDQARRVLEAIGSGERTHATIAATAGSRSGALPSGTLSPLLHRLSTDKHVVAVDQPLSIKPGKPASTGSPTATCGSTSLPCARLKTWFDEDGARPPTSCSPDTGPRGAAKLSNPLCETRSNSARSQAHCHGNRSPPSAAGGTARSTLSSTSSAPTAPPSPIE